MWKNALVRTHLKDLWAYLLLLIRCRSARSGGIEGARRTSQKPLGRERRAGGIEKVIPEAWLCHALSLVTIYGCFMLFLRSALGVSQICVRGHRLAAWQGRPMRTPCRGPTTRAPTPTGRRCTRGPCRPTGLPTCRAAEGHWHGKPRLRPAYPPRGSQMRWSNGWWPSRHLFSPESAIKWTSKGFQLYRLRSAPVWGASEVQARSPRHGLRLRPAYPVASPGQHAKLGI